MDPVDQDSAPDIDVSGAIRTMQIINGALIAGVAVCALVMLGPADGELEMLGMIATGFAVVTTIVVGRPGRGDRGQDRAALSAVSTVGWANVKPAASSLVGKAR